VVCVYKITNTLNGKVYIGKANDMNRRWVEHLSVARRGSRKPLYAALRKYGSARGYNLTSGGEGVRNVDPEIRRRLVEKAKIRNKGKGNPFYGKTHSEECKARLRNAALKRYQNQPHPRKGVSHTSETREKIRNTKLGKQVWNSDEKTSIGRRFSGEKSSTAKVTNDQAKELRVLRGEGIAIEELQSRFGLSRSSVYRIIGRQTFKEV